MDRYLKLLRPAMLLAAINFAALARAEAVDTRIGEIELEMGLPANAQVEQKIYDEMDFQRACQAYIWALPIVAMTSLAT